MGIRCKMVAKSTGQEKRRRGRPRGFDTDVALGAVTERFRTQGFAATSLDDLVDATGLSRPSLYAAFGDKKALYLTVLAGATGRTERALALLAAAGLPLREAVMGILAYAIDGFLKGERGPSGCIVIGTAPQESIIDADVRQALARFVRVEDDGIADILRTAGSANPQAHARIVAAVVHSLSVRARAGAEREELLRIAADCVELVT